MTVSYNREVATSRPWTFIRILAKWKGSIWKSIGTELALWLLLYASVSVVYRVVLNPTQKRLFERVSDYCDEKMSYLPLNFMLSFFVNCIIHRWRVTVENIGWIDNVALLVSQYVEGFDEKSRMLRRSIVRYCCLAQALVLRDMSMKVRRRLPTLDTLVAAGFLMEHEKEKFEDVKIRYAKYWVPIQWALTLLRNARKQQKIDSDMCLTAVSEEVVKFRKGLAKLSSQDSVPIPLMYPQLVYLAVHTYFLVCLIGRQHIVGENAVNKSKIDLYFPFMTVFEFVFYVGWLKVAESILNPLGEDDDDYETNFLIDRNLATAFKIVDDSYRDAPLPEKDLFWADEVLPLYSVESAEEERKQNGIVGSTEHVKLGENVCEVRMTSLLRDDNEQMNTVEMNTTRGDPPLTRSLRFNVVPVKKHERNDSQTSHIFEDLRRKFSRRDERPKSLRRSVITSEKGVTVENGTGKPVDGHHKRSASAKPADGDTLSSFAFFSAVSECSECSDTTVVTTADDRRGTSEVSAATNGNVVDDGIKHSL